MCAIEVTSEGKPGIAQPTLYFRCSFYIDVGACSKSKISNRRVIFI